MMVYITWIYKGKDAVFIYNYWLIIHIFVVTYLFNYLFIYSENNIWVIIRWLYIITDEMWLYGENYKSNKLVIDS